MRSRKMQGGGWFAGIEDVQIYAIRGETQKALDAFETAVDNKWSFYSASLVGYGDPHLDSIVDEPRYQALVERLRQRMAAERAWFEANRDLPLD